MKEAVIVSGARTAVGRAPRGSLRTTRPDDMAGAAIKEALRRAPGFDPAEVEDVIIGCAFPEGAQGMNVARLAAARAGLPVSVPAQSVNRFCSSGLQTIATAAERIMTGMATTIVAGGTESMTMTIETPNFSPNPELVRTYPAYYMGMGLTAEQVAKEFQISREEQDAFALRSHQRAAKAVDSGLFDEEILPLDVDIESFSENGEVQHEKLVFRRDEGPRRDTSLEGLAKLKPAFKFKGTVTAGNSSQRSDGAAAVVVMERERAQQLGLKPLVRYIGFAVAGVRPEVMGIGPIEAVPKVLKLTGLSSDKMVAPELFRPPVDFPDVPYDHLLRMAAERTPDRTAIVYHNLILTYREVVSMVNSIAHGLHELGLQKGDRICLCTGNRPEYAITINAAATIGAAISPMNPLYKEREMAYQLENSEARAIVILPELLPQLQRVLSQESLPHLKHIIVTGKDVPEGVPGALPFARLLWESSPRRPRQVEISGDDLLALPYSSGTTGLPKGAMLTHRNLTTNHLQFLTAAGITSSDATLIFLPSYHIYGVLLTGSFLAAGATQVIMDRFEMQQALDLCEKYGVTWFFAVPPLVIALANSPDDLHQMNTLRYLMSAAAPLPMEPARKLRKKIGVNIVQAYGMTETSPITHLSPRDPDLVRLDSPGLPMNNTEQKIVDLESGERELPVGEDGEIIVRGPQVMAGYWKAPEETARALRDGWFYTGDIGHVDADGYTYIVDRKKEMIKYKGFSIAPAELEGLLVEHPAVLEAAVIGVPDEEVGEAPKGFVVLRSGHTVTVDEIIVFVNSKLTGYKKLHALEFIDVIPKVPSGKILRRELKEREKVLHVGRQV